jgi:hypothetical protein
LNDGNNGSYGDWDDQVTIIALDENGQQVPVTFTGGNINVNGNTVESDSASSTAPLNGSNADNVEVSIQGPISSLQIIYENGPDNNVTGYLGVSDLSVTSVTPDDGGASGSGSNDDGDDVIDGGAGDDLIYGDNGAGTPDVGQDASPVEINLANVRPGSETSGGGNSDAGDSIIYNNVATLADGTAISARLVLVSTTDNNLTVDLAHSSDYEVLLGGGTSVNGEEAEFRLEFFETVSGAPVAIDSSLVIADLDIRGGGEKI